MYEPEFFEFALADPNFRIDALFRRMAMLPHAVFLDGSGKTTANASQTSELNRYSFLAADPVDRLIVNKSDSFDFGEIRKLLRRYPSTGLPDLPPFQGGLAGMLAYELNGTLESIPGPVIDDFPVPLVALFLYDVVVAIDHWSQTGWIISQGWPESDRRRRSIRARARLDLFRAIVQMEIELPIHCQVSEPIQPVSPMHRMPHSIELYSSLSREQFLNMISRAVRFIHSGDIFQVNLSQRLLTPATASPVDLYLQLRLANPAPFSGYFDFGDGQLISASPERLVNLRGRAIETRPIKGTRRRTRHPEVDIDVRQELLTSEKDRAENVMIVDLMRNDLSRIAEPDSVLVRQLCGIEEFQSVLHLVSVIEGQLQLAHDFADVLRAVFPGGSITGAPKIRAMEIISELEPTARGPYCGSLGYINHDGTLDFNILIRTITSKSGWWQIPVGGGIVTDSDPETEYEETWTKSIGMLSAIAAMAAVAGEPTAKSNLAPLS